jgi:hypothetical protein
MGSFFNIYHMYDSNQQQICYILFLFIYTVSSWQISVLIFIYIYNSCFTESLIIFCVFLTELQKYAGLLARSELTGTGDFGQRIWVSGFC